jgi:hypothetical protein
MNSSNGRIIEDHAVYAGNGKMVTEIRLHRFPVTPFKMASSHNPVCQGKTVSVTQAVDQVDLSGSDKLEKQNDLHRNN